MMKMSNSRSVSWAGRRAALILALALLAPMLIAAFSYSTPGSLPETAAWSVGAPDRQIRVIAQKMDDSQAAEQLVASLGGQVVTDLRIINAFAAEMSAAAADELAASGTVRWISLDAPVENSGKIISVRDAVSNTYLQTLEVPIARAMGYDGSGVGVAVIDSGVTTHDGFNLNLYALELGAVFTNSRLVTQLNFNKSTDSPEDFYGHGTHVAGIIAGNGGLAGDKLGGVAPGANIISLKISDKTGMGYESDTVAAMQWVLENKDLYNIRVVNLSINSTTEQSYHESPMDAAAEILWFNGIVVVASAGNRSTNWLHDTVNTSPANDPFIIVVGAIDEAGTAKPADDMIAEFSASGVTMDGHLRPDILAPGKNIYSTLASTSGWGYIYPERTTENGSYFRLSGTSMSAPMVAGAAAMLLQAEPQLTPDQVKYRLTHAAATFTAQSDKIAADFPRMNVYQALTTPTKESANTDLQPSRLLWTGTEPVNWGSVSWNSVSWNSVSWNSVSWNSVSWNSVSWNSVSWSD